MTTSIRATEKRLNPNPIGSASCVLSISIASALLVALNSLTGTPSTSIFLSANSVIRSTSGSSSTTNTRHSGNHSMRKLLSGLHDTFNHGSCGEDNCSGWLVTITVPSRLHEVPESAAAAHSGVPRPATCQPRDQGCQLVWMRCLHCGRFHILYKLAGSERYHK